MLIDWFTVSAQALNFVVLVWLMKRFLYKPILHAIDAREKHVAAELADADATRAEADKERDLFQQKNEAFEQTRVALLAQATEEAEAERTRLGDEARESVAALRAQREQTLRDDAHDLSQAIGRRARDEVFSVARRALMDLSGTSLEERMCEVFIRRVRQMESRAKACLDASLITASGSVLVRSAFDLAAPQRTAIHRALDETFSGEVQLRFETSPSLIAGIELVTNGQKVAWNVEDYLGSLEESVGELLGQPSPSLPEDTSEAVAVSNEGADEQQPQPA